MLNLSETTRAYIYRVLVAVGALLVLYGVVGQDELNEWLVLAGTLLSVESTLASKHTSRKGGQELS